MIRGLYSSASAMDALTLRQDAIAQNLAHVNMPGYRRHSVTFESVGMRDDIRGTQATTHTSHAAGPLIKTGNPLDLALSQNGFFVLDGPNGPLYTRNGTFRVNGQGQIVSHAESQGINPGDAPFSLPLMGANGPLEVPPNTTQITVRPDGMVIADNRDEVGRVQVARFRNGERDLLKRAGTTLFETPPNVAPLPVAAEPEEGVPPTADRAIPPIDEVLAGYRESSNVNGVGQLVEMLSSLRQFEASQRALRTLGETIRLRTRPQ